MYFFTLIAELRPRPEKITCVLPQNANFASQISSRSVQQSLNISRNKRNTLIK